MKHVYSFSRRFDLASMFVAVALWSAPLTLCRVLDLPRQASAGLFLLFLIVAGAQLLFSPLGRPRTVSVVAGVVCVVVVCIAAAPEIVGFMLGGAFLGYLAGVCIAAAPLITDLIRSAARRFSGSKNTNTPESD